jgi:hypothetical protein
MIFSSNMTVDTQFFLDGVLLDVVDHFTYLGFRIDRRLTFTDEITHITGKLASCSSVLSRCRCFLDTDTLYKLFNCLAVPYINYSHTFISFVSKRDFSKLQVAYENIGKVIFSCVNSNPDVAVWMSLKHRLYRMNLLFIFNIVHKSFAPALIFSLHYLNKTYNTRNKNTFVHPRVNKSVTTRAFYYWAPRIWDTLPASYRVDMSKERFKNYLDVLDLSQFVCSIPNFM